MYSKNAKWKQVLKCSNLSEDLLLKIVIDNYAAEGYDENIHVDYYWNAALGLFVVIDGHGKYLTLYRNHHQLSRLPALAIQVAKQVWSK